MLTATAAAAAAAAAATAAAVAVVVAFVFVLAFTFTFAVELEPTAGVATPVVSRMVEAPGRTVCCWPVDPVAPWW